MDVEELNELKWRAYKKANAVNLEPLSNVHYLICVIMELSEAVDNREDKLANAVVRLLEFAGANGIELDDYKEEYEIDQKTCNLFKVVLKIEFSNVIFALIEQLIMRYKHIELSLFIQELIFSIVEIARYINIDLWDLVRNKISITKNLIN